jgi:hypothetical protein
MCYVYNKDFVRFCRDCRYSRMQDETDFMLRCTHPDVNAKRAHVLAAAIETGSFAQDERAGGWFYPCGRRGALWQAKPLTFTY